MIITKNNTRYPVICILLFWACITTSYSQNLPQPESSSSSNNDSPKFIDNISISRNTSKIKIKTESSNYSSEPPIRQTNETIIPETIQPVFKQDKPSISLSQNEPITQPIKTNNNCKSNLFCNIIQSKYANILGVLPTTITNFSLYYFIDDWFGVRYRMGGNDKTGIDCSAFAQRLYENVFCTNLVRTAFEQFNESDLRVKKRNLKEGDLVFFGTKRKRRKRRITHVGIYLMNNYFVHASSSQGVTISSLDDPYWSHKYIGAGEVEKETD